MSLCGGLRRHMTIFDPKKFSIANFFKFRINLWFRFNNSLDPDPDSAKFLDPEPKHFSTYNVRNILDVISL
jgi:hypothetical protein